jgi:HopA1 effector protein family
MQLLSLQNQPLDTAPQELQAALQDIANKVEIVESNFCIRHPDYKPLELPTEAIERFGQLPSDLQNKYLSLQLRSFLYGIYYNGSLKEALAPNADTDDLALHQNLENNTLLGIDLAFYGRLEQSNCGKGNFDPDWQVLREESDGSLAVNKGGLTLHVDRDRHLQPTAHTAVGETVAIRLPSNRVQNGFYMAIGNAGSHDRRNPDAQNLVRVYFNFTPEGAVAVMGSLTQQLNDISLPFSFKVLYNPANYGRYDSGVLYFDKSNYEAVKPVLEAVYVEHQSHFQPEVPLFTKQLALGLGLAEEPDRTFAEQESFGMNRCQIVANGLLEALRQGDDSPTGRIAAILQHFSLLEIDWQHPYLNANSDDIYTPLGF